MHRRHVTACGSEGVGMQLYLRTAVQACSLCRPVSQQPHYPQASPPSPTPRHRESPRQLSCMRPRGRSTDAQHQTDKTHTHTHARPHANACPRAGRPVALADTVEGRRLALTARLLSCYNSLAMHSLLCSAVNTRTQQQRRASGCTGLCAHTLPRAPTCRHRAVHAEAVQHEVAQVVHGDLHGPPRRPAVQHHAHLGGTGRHVVLTVVAPLVCERSGTGQVGGRQPPLPRGSFEQEEGRGGQAVVQVEDTRRARGAQPCRRPGMRAASRRSWTPCARKRTPQRPPAGQSGAGQARACRRVP